MGIHRHQGSVVLGAGVSFCRGRLGSVGLSQSVAPRFVLVNGVPVNEEGRMTNGLPGKVLT
ncbi:MAG: hypothetical protein ABI806_26535, partial [Candidatus Solibacter sp.]